MLTQLAIKAIKTYFSVTLSPSFLADNRVGCIGSNSTIVVLVSAHLHVTVHPPVSAPAVYRYINFVIKSIREGKKYDNFACYYIDYLIQLIISVNLPVFDYPVVLALIPSIADY